MTGQLGLFEGQRRQDDGIGRVAENAKDWLEQMRAEARRVFARKGEVSCDDLRIYADRINEHPHHPNAWGAVFKTKEWRIVGYTRSRYRSNHARRIAIWRIVQ